MSSPFSVDLNQLDQVVARLHALAGFLHDHLDELDHKVATLTTGNWESAAASAYQNAHTQWMDSAREFADGIAQMSDAAQKAHGHYTQAIDLNNRMLQGGTA